MQGLKAKYTGRRGDDVKLNVVHGACGLFAAGFVATGGAELVLGLGVFAGLVHGFLAGIFGDVFCRGMINMYIKEEG